MAPIGHPSNAGDTDLRRFYVYTLGFLKSRRIRHILRTAGWKVTVGRPSDRDVIGVWGKSPYAARGEAMAEKTGARIVRVEDAWLRSLHPGRAGEPPLGLLIDEKGVHFDPEQPSDLETLLMTEPLDDSALLARANGVIAWMRRAHLSKYSAFDPDIPVPDPGYVLVIDQTAGDASVTASRADVSRFREMLFVAREEHPHAHIVVKGHPETAAGFRQGHLSNKDLSQNMSFAPDRASPWALLDGAIAVYTVSSQMGFEAILAGHKPRVFGQPFYAGWGLTEDENPVYRRAARKLTRAQLVAGAMVLYPVWYDPYRNRRCEVETVLATLEAEARAWREDRAGWVAQGMRLWKRGPLKGFYGSGRGIRFEDDPAKAEELAVTDNRRLMAWSSKAAPDADLVRVEDGFLRSQGLGANLVPPMSLVTDDMGIYYDPSCPSRLEQLIADSVNLPLDQIERAHRLIRFLVDGRLSKYNLMGEVPKLPAGHRILVPGQVEDDASILLGAGDIRQNADLLAKVRAENRDAVVLWKPHPDVEAGLRTGDVATPGQWANQTLRGVDMGALLGEVDEVWTMTSLTGFEALMRGCRVTTTGAPFYAGWGLTRDLGDIPARRLTGPRPTLEGLVHATLIAYPRYRDPVTGRPCPVEVVAERLKCGNLPKPGPANRVLSKLQGLLASQSHLWRR